MSYENPNNKKSIFNPYHPDSLKEAYSLISKMQSPAKASNNLYVGLSHGGHATNKSNLKCQGGVCNLGTSEQSSRGSTTPF